MPRVDNDLYSVSYSEMEVFKDCKRRWMLQYYLRLKRKFERKVVARDTGSLVHNALHEFYLLGGLNGGRIAKDRTVEYLALAHDTDIANAREDQRSAIEEIHAYGVLITEGYIKWLEETGADAAYEFTGTEIEIVAPGPVEGTQLLGILDLAGTHKQSGDLVVMDTKVVGSIDDMIQSLGINEQGPMYAVLSKVTDPNPNRGFRVVWNMLKRNKRTARANPPFYQRYELAVNEDQLRQFYTQLQGTIEDILRTEARLQSGEHHVKVAYPTPSSSCSWKCPYMALCSQMNDPRSDPEWTISEYFTTPEQREGARIAEETRATQAEALVLQEA